MLPEDPVFPAERLFPRKEIVTNTPTGRERTTYGAWAERTRRLGTVLDNLGKGASGAAVQNLRLMLGL